MKMYLVVRALTPSPPLPEMLPCSEWAPSNAEHQPARPPHSESPNQPQTWASLTQPESPTTQQSKQPTLLFPLTPHLICQTLLPFANYSLQDGTHAGPLLSSINAQCSKSIFFSMTLSVGFTLEIHCDLPIREDGKYNYWKQPRTHAIQIHRLSELDKLGPHTRTIRRSIDRHL